MIDTQTKKKLLIEDKRDAAIHEAGHAVASHVLGWDWFAEIERAEGERARFGKTSDGAICLRRGVWVGQNSNEYDDLKTFGRAQRAIICWAGAIAEYILTRQDEEVDLVQFQEMTSSLIESGHHDFCCTQVGVSDGDAYGITFLQTAEEREQTLRNAWTLIEQNKDLVLKIAKRLERDEYTCREDWLGVTLATA